ncbi:MAG: hypothetical protein LH615_09405, partial [Ferruginibacter sp.]|nr:hypothetical protein [Ferruginibacter sp.]
MLFSDNFLCRNITHQKQRFALNFYIHHYLFILFKNKEHIKSIAPKIVKWDLNDYDYSKYREILRHTLYKG